MGRSYRRKECLALRRGRRTLVNAVRENICHGVDLALIIGSQKVICAGGGGGRRDYTRSRACNVVSRGKGIFETDDVRRLRANHIARRSKAAVELPKREGRGDCGDLIQIRIVGGGGQIAAGTERGDQLDGRIVDRAVVQNARISPGSRHVDLGVAARAAIVAIDIEGSIRMGGYGGSGQNARRSGTIACRARGKNIDHSAIDRLLPTVDTAFEPRDGDCSRRRRKRSANSAAGQYRQSGQCAQGEGANNTWEME